MEEVYMVKKSLKGGWKEKLVVVFDTLSDALDFIDQMEFDGSKNDWWIDAANYNPTPNEWGQLK